MARKPRPDPYAPNAHGVLYRCVGPTGLGSRSVRASSPGAALTALALCWATPKRSELMVWDHAAQDWQRVEG